MRLDNNMGTETLPTYTVSAASSSQDPKQSDNSNSLAVPHRSGESSSSSRSASVDGSRRGSRGASGAWDRPSASSTETFISQQNAKANKQQGIMSKLMSTKYTPSFLQ
ncbi:hypothetical protein LTR53_006546 [Teratosphaeriaceae sp. CCFEE 6253]|nr:hypothetical protein LTR53_006546 [Teratosphaeriaceae sp. CCFEE 6253]